MSAFSPKVFILYHFSTFRVQFGILHLSAPTAVRKRSYSVNSQLKIARHVHGCASSNRASTSFLFWNVVLDKTQRIGNDTRTLLEFGEPRTGYLQSLGRYHLSLKTARLCADRFVKAYALPTVRHFAFLEETCDAERPQIQKPWILTAGGYPNG